jgi:hypothetical protein
MERTRVLIGVGVTVALAILACRPAAGPASGDDAKYTLKVPGGLDFAEFRGYEQWETIAVSHNGDLLAVILGNPAMIAAYKAGIPGNGKPVPRRRQNGEGPFNIHDIGYST